MRTPNVDFVGRTRIWLILTTVVMAVSIGALVFLRLDLSIDFVGGTSFVLEDLGNTEVTADALHDAAIDAGAADVTAQVKVDGDVATGAIVRTDELSPGTAEEQAVKDAVVEVAQAGNVQVSFVGPTWGDRISRKAIQALVVFLVIVVLYISVRLDFKMAVGAVIALFHDLLLTAGIYALVGFQVSPSTVIALLTILGYSLYDTVVVFDRVQENTQRLGGPGRRTYSEAVNTSMNEVLWRSLNTSLTSLLPVGSLLFIGSQALGATTLQDLALALFVGMATGTYSSLVIAGPFVAWWREREPEHERLRLRAERKRRQAATTASTDDEAHEAELEAAPEAEGREPDEDDTTYDPTETPGYVRGPGRTPRRKR